MTSQLYTGTTQKTDLVSKLTALRYSPSIAYDPNTHKIDISISSYSFKFLTDHELKTIDNLDPAFHWQGTAYDKIQSANEILKNTGTVSSTHNNASPFESYIDLQPCRNIYIRH